MMSRLGDEFPAADLEKLKRLSNGEEKYPDEGLSSQDVTLNGINMTLLLRYEFKVRT
jgi:hypothetical protein